MLNAIAPKDPRSAGFTLVELLVAMAVFGMTASMLLGGVFGLTKFQQKDVTSPLPHEAVISAQTILRERLSRIVGVLRADANTAQIDFQGGEAQLGFFAPVLPMHAPDAVERYRLLLTSSGDLILYSSSGLNRNIDLENLALSGWRQTRLLTGVRDIQISYFGSEPLGTDRIWQSRWTDRRDLPILVRIKLSLDGEDGNYWPDLIVRPRANVNLICRIDQFSQRCKGQP